MRRFALRRTLNYQLLTLFPSLHSPLGGLGARAWGLLGGLGASLQRIDGFADFLVAEGLVLERAALVVVATEDLILQVVLDMATVAEEVSAEVSIAELGLQLLELGAGFNMEYTGIENIYLLLVVRVLMAAVIYVVAMWLSGAKIFKECIGYLRKK